MRVALERLGYKCFHGRIMDQFPGMYALWEEALLAKYYGQGQPYGRRDFDKLLSGFDVSCNYPGTMLAAELIEAYPEAKVILTNRDVDKWQQSMKMSVDVGATWNSWDWIAPFDPIYGPWWNFHKFEHALRPKLAPNGERKGYLDHYEMIRKLVPKERLLDYHVSQGWIPICEFLGKELPAEPFPHVNDTNQFLKGRRWRWWHAIYCMATSLAPSLAIAAVSVATAWQYRHSLSKIWPLGSIIQAMNNRK
ncbi:hypothetical protein F4819DRAFT_442399 [Hypoxylon fuscum]|nr:hypothetical protein F4819DRAFT_442399 [Hypoxylon fuscum]